MTADLNWFGMLSHHATRNPNRTLTLFEGRSISYREMLESATVLASGLHGMGVQTYSK